MSGIGGWESVRTSVRDEVGSSAYESWFSNLEARSQGDRLVLVCPDRFSRDWIQRRYGAAVERAAKAYRSVLYEVATGSTEGALEPRKAANPSESTDIGGSKPRTAAPSPTRPTPPRGTRELSFDTFVLGSSNALALEASRALASDDPGRCTPLLIAGDSGCGKTHLCRAIAASTRQHVVYRSSEEFTSEVTVAMRHGGMEAVRHRYRKSAGLLILEDVQQLAGKRATQLELLHTLEHLIRHGKSVVLTADRAPQALELEPRLASRMGSGLIARIGGADARMRREILRTRAAAGGFRLPDDCLDLLSARNVGSVADLVAGLNQLVARATLLGRPICRELVHETLADIDLLPRPVGMDEIMEATARMYGLEPDALRARSRARQIVRPRHLAMYLCRRYTHASLKEIGRAFRRDHTSVLHAVRSVERRVAAEPRVRYELEALASRFGPLSATP